MARRRSSRPAKSKTSAPSPEPAKRGLADENARLRRALARERGRRRALEQAAAGVGRAPVAPSDAARQQQAATAEILYLISTSPGDEQPVFDAIARHALRLCKARGAVVARYDGTLMHVVAHENLNPETIERLAKRFPKVPDRHNPAECAVLDGVVVQVPDFQAATEFTGSVARQFGARSHLAVPLMLRGRAIGSIGVSRPVLGPFPDEEIALLKTFAEQAVIAIENARLVREIEGRNRELAESLEQQTATAEVLRVISSSPTDIQPVLDTVAQSAAALCQAVDAVIMLEEAGVLVRRAIIGRPAFSQVAIPWAVDRGSAAGRAFIDRRPVHVHDLLAAADEFPGAYERTVATGDRTVLCVPLLRKGAAIGIILIRRTEVAPFSDQHIALLQTFADQAVIAIENVRLFTELQARNAELTESLEQQTATAEILRVITSSPSDFQPVFDTIIDRAARLCDARLGALLRFDGETIHLAAHAREADAESLRALRAMYPAPLSAAGVTARALLTGRVVHVHDMRQDSELTQTPTARAGHRTVLSVPMMHEGVPIGAITVARARVAPFSSRQVDMVKIFADQAVIAIENVRLFKALEARNRDLTESLEQQTATAEVLRVISGSPTDAQPVFDAIVGSARRLLGGLTAAATQVVGDALHLAALTTTSAEGDALLRAAYPRTLDDDSPSAQAVRERRPAIAIDTETDARPRTREIGRARGYRSYVSVPMLRDGAAVGTINVTRREPGAFAPEEIALLQTFADQAVIAIENARLFRVLEDRNAELTEALEQQTATSEVLRAISGSPTDAQPVLDIIAQNATRVCGARDGAVLLKDGTDLCPVAHHGPLAFAIGDFRARVPIGRDWVSGRALLDRRTIQVEDLLAAGGEYPLGLEMARQDGHRTTLATPLLREGEPIGVLLIRRGEVRPFTPKQMALLETFAAQAVIAIENVRLFTELEARNRDLAENLEQQTATAEILKIISTSPTDLQPVLDTVVRSAARFCGSPDAILFQIDGGQLRLTAHHGPQDRYLGLLVPLTPGTVGGRCVLEQRAVQVDDLRAETERFPEGSAFARQFGHRTVLSVPLLREGAAIGTIALRRYEVHPFTDKQVALLKIFADQAVIAIENVRLFTELEARNRALAESLEQQTATGDILRIISTSPTDLQPVLDAVVRSAARFCGAYDAHLFEVDGNHLRATAHYGPLPTSTRLRPLVRGMTTGRAILDRRAVHVKDLQAEIDEFPEGSAFARELGHRAVLCAPLLREGVAIGAISLRRTEPDPFTDKQIALLQTFADQAVIAIENVRLFRELEARNRDLTESLEQQMATGDILRIISTSPTDLQPVLDAVVRSAVRFCGAADATIFEVEGDTLRMKAHHGSIPRPVDEPPVPIVRGTVNGRALLERRAVHVADLQAEAGEYPQGSALGRTLGHRTVLSAPLLREGAAIGTIALRRAAPHPFTDKQVALLQSFADQAVIAIENVRLFKELEARNRDLGVSLERQTATAEILRVISASPTDLRPVFDTILQSALRLCGAVNGGIWRLEGGVLSPVAVAGARSPEWDALASAIRPRSPSRDTVSGWVVLQAQVLSVPDIVAESRFPNAQRVAATMGIRHVLGVPMLREGVAVGSMVLNKMEPASFDERQIDLLRTFADQAVIAIENARLFTELQARTAELQRSVGQLTALGEVGQAVSSSLDLETVLTTIMSRAVQLSGLDGGVMFEYDEAAETFVQRAATQTQALTVAARVGLRKGEGVVGRTALTLEPVQVPDIAAAGAYEGRGRAALIEAGVRALLAVPIVREGRLLGGLAVSRNRPGEFPAETVDLLRTFAAQSALAIQNARLFQQLDAANRHKSAFLASMSHELRTPLNAIIGYSEMLQEEATDVGQPGLVPDLGKITVAGKYLLELINTVLDLSKIEAGRMDVYLETFGVRALLDEVMAVAQPLAERRDNRLVLTCAPDVGEMRADLTKVRQTLFNLLSNACKFTDKGTVTLSARLEAPAGSPAWVVFDVADTGIGMTAEQIGRLFEEFSQADVSTTRRYGGTGLGLALSRRLCRLMGGEVSVVSEEGRGSTFTVRLPREVAEPQPPAPGNGAARDAGAVGRDASRA